MTQYIGRFAPSPSGPLHFGSMVAALGSYFQAKSQHGQWLVRIEDLDPPREMAGAASLILKTLESYGLHWDQDVIYQSQRHPIYQQQIDDWLDSGLGYYCQCSRKQIKQDGGFYLGHCRDKNLPATDCSVRLVIDTPVTQFVDQKHGIIDIPTDLAQEDFIIKRRDGLFAYNLAVVLDDIAQGITEVVRGADLIEPTGRQINLYRYLNHPEVKYLHLPLAINAHGDKLSKQNHAPAVDLANPKPVIILAMQFLGFSLPDDFQSANIEQMLAWGCQHWALSQLPSTLSAPCPF
ncbi:MULTISPECIES: tRNA glutamyl-Q(34) synthetase GluQRS [Vibrio]|uniref:Glutamyl-Q tRNA(Asp) synthetase n=1 Tax=Vibrio algicola TaxID=2662262 RepID=A0A5Q0TDP9_9VIBR|nr:MULTISPECIES: tRNA glutamyl-Q(34) synthetase GluQRS [Vibrio]MBD1576573.1 tRNA glutamyl-Q(34) synthetase GluQRS [Vibrio sp. S11_S32]